jgi:3-dehydroquinate synthase
LCEDELLWEALQDATRHRDGLQRCPLPHGIGKAVFVNDLTAQEIVDACRVLGSVTVSSRL